ncbi:MAG: glycosyltransferase family 4 protein [Bacteroidota bacterium]
MKVGFDAKRIFYNKTGLGNYSRFVLAALNTFDSSVQQFLFTPKPPTDLFALQKNMQLVMPENGMEKALSGLWRLVGIPAQLNELGCDVYHGLSNELPLNISSFKGKKVVTIHDLIFLRYPHYYGRIDRWIYYKKFKLAAQHADVVIATSKQTADDINQFLGIPSSKIKVVYQDCDVQFSKEISLSEVENTKQKYNLNVPYYLCVGTVEERKNQLNVLKAFHLSNCGMQLVFVGKPTSYLDQLTAYIQQHQFSNHVRFIHDASFADFPALYKGAKASVYASRFEGFGIPVLESLRCGTSVFAANTSSLVEVGGTLAHYFHPDDIETLSMFFNQSFLLDQNLSYREHLRQFNGSTIAEQLLEIYRN